MLTGHYSRVNMDDMQLTGAPVYRLSMIAEAYATKGTITHFSCKTFLFALIHALSLLCHMVAVDGRIKAHWMTFNFFVI